MPYRFIAAWFLWMQAAAPAVEFRIATFNIGADFTGGTSAFSLGAPGTPDHDAVRDVLRRIDADVVALQEIHSADTSGSPSHLTSLAESAGYPNRHLPGFTSLDFTFRVAILSRHPFLQTGQISSPAGANELARRFPAVVVDVPGTSRDPLVISGHLKSGTTQADRFRRAIELRRLTRHLESRGTTADDNFIILGDFNLSSSPTSFQSAPAISGSYTLGADILFPVSYSINPLSYFSNPDVARLDPRHLNGSASTFNTSHTAGPVLDLILVSPAIAARPLGAEIYNSVFDTSDNAGLRKWGEPLPSGTSAAASDHYAVFADLELDQAYPDLHLSASAQSLAEGETITLNVTLPALRENGVTVHLASNHAAALPAEAAVVIAAGGTRAQVAAAASRNFVRDPARQVVFTATSSGHNTATTTVTLLDADIPYELAGDDGLMETFGGFAGAHAPAPWTTAGGVWRGSDDGSGSSPGFRSYGNGSLGWLGDGSSAMASTVVTNSTGRTITSLEISHATEQWQLASHGPRDRVSASLKHGRTVHALEGLEFTTVSSGEPPPRAVFTHTLDGLSIHPGDIFELRFDFEPGPDDRPPPADVFVNEFHYDNSGEDSGEFVEVAVGPGFTGSTNSISLVLYNGADGRTYGTHRLDTFTAGTLAPSGHRLFWKSIAGIQNGAPDGLAIVADGKVLHFISYEGTFTATNGPAAGLVSTDIGVAQTGAGPAGSGSLGLAGDGGVAAAFLWTKFTDLPFSPGEPNRGQAFTAASPSQGLAIDDIVIRPLATADADSDGDGWTDLEEELLGTDPADSGSFFVIELAGRQLGFQALAGRAYLVQTSTDLVEWEPFALIAGSGERVALELPDEGPWLFARVRVSLPE